MDTKHMQSRLSDHLIQIYGVSEAEKWENQFLSLLLEKAQELGSGRKEKTNCTELHSALLITYADSLLSEKRSPLATLTDFLEIHVKDAISTIHLLPFYPASSDDGFSVIDPVKVDERNGTWDDIKRLNSSYLLMFDLVANHLSQHNDWIQRYLQGDPDFADFAIEVNGDEDISQVFRPRALPLFSSLSHAGGPRKLVWTTFSADQIDINYRNPKVLLFILDVLLTYIGKGASLVRLDAIAFIWKELGTSCLHHENTHRIIRFFRWALETCSPGTGIITETNVPHKENISYFGNGHDEASLVYNFPLPPLTLHTFLTEDTTKLSQWASTLEFPSEEVTYFNFLASHDGVGVIPAKGILSQEEIAYMASHVESQGGFVSFKSEGDGSKTPYELNCSYLSAISGLTPEETTPIRAKRFIATQAIMLSLRGIPGIYIHSLLGSENCHACPEIASNPRRINREKLQVSALKEILSDPNALRSLVLNEYLRLLNIRKEEKAFRPSSKQQVVLVSPSLFTVLRTADNGERLLAVINVSGNSVAFDFRRALETLSLKGNEQTWQDLLSEMVYGREPGNISEMELSPYQVCWFKG